MLDWINSIWKIFNNIKREMQTIFLIQCKEYFIFQILCFQSFLFMPYVFLFFLGGGWQKYIQEKCINEKKKMMLYYIRYLMTIILLISYFLY